MEQISPPYLFTPPVVHSSHVSTSHVIGQRKGVLNAFEMTQSPFFIQTITQLLNHHAEKNEPQFCVALTSVSA